MILEDAYRTRAWDVAHAIVPVFTLATVVRAWWPTMR
jgi:hypothetical protein